MSDVLLGNYVTPDTINLWYAMNATDILVLTTSDDPSSTGYTSVFTLSKSFELAILDIRSIVRSPYTYTSTEPCVIVPGMVSFPVLIEGNGSTYADHIKLTTTSSSLSFYVNGSSGYQNTFSMLLYIMK